MSRFTDLFQEPAPAPEPTPEPTKVEEVVVQKPVVDNKASKKKFTME
jgi:ribosomal protein S10